MNILLTPARIGPVEIKNRIVMPPMTTRTADDEGFVTEDCITYYLARVRGGTGLITVEMASPEKGFGNEALVVGRARGHWRHDDTVFNFDRTDPRRGEEDVHWRDFDC